MVGTEMQVFTHLEKIVEALLECPDPSGKRPSNGYKYRDSPYDKMSSEILGANFKVDAVIGNPNIYKTEDETEGIAVAAAQTAVALEFKKDTTDENVHEVSVWTSAMTSLSHNPPQNRKQLVSAANHIMNDDPRRNWMYGVRLTSPSSCITANNSKITIENTNMSLWYFSRSYSMKSASFNFKTVRFRPFFISLVNTNTLCVGVQDIHSSLPILPVCNG
jgi:hypothetical protein